MQVEFVINTVITPRYLALLIIFTRVPLLDGRFKWEIGAFIRLGGMITILVLAGLTDTLFTLHHEWRWCSSVLRLISSCSEFEPFTKKTSIICE